MADLNHVTLIGRLTRDAELKYTPGGLAISSFSIAVNRRRKNGDQWVDEVSYFDINLYGKPAESLKQYLTKGKQVAVDGELRQDRWEKDGQNHSRIYIAANNVQLLGGNSGSSNYSNAGGYVPANNNSQGYNQGYSQPQNSYKPRYDAPQDQYDPGSSYGSDSSFPEDIPF
ncbi:MAG: single-stranded DNA-binding protein [Spirochaetaceae bacterium]|nr:single-stranded DNA-binding protein [Spirochaetaceae bacterium]